MFDYYQPKEKEPADYTFLIMWAILLPVFGLIALLANADMGMTVVIVLAATTFAIKFHWDLRKHVWFWATIVCVFALHVPLFFWIRWPWGNLRRRGGPEGLFLLADGLIILVIVELADRFFSKDSSL